MFVLFGALMIAAAPAASPLPSAGGVEPIVITAQRIRAAQDALRACLARHCDPNEDIDASLALAETQLLGGKYGAARSTLLAALGRNKHEASRYPIPVSDLYRANGKVAAHLGIDWDYYRSTWGIYRTLKNGLPSDDVRKFSALMEIAEMEYRTRGHERARLYYESIAHRARDAGRPDIAALAELRSATRHLPPGSSWQVNEIRRIAGLDASGMRAPVLEAKLALARMAYAKGDEQGAQALQRELAALAIRQPILIYSPPYQLSARDTNSADENFGMEDASITTVGVGATAFDDGGGVIGGGNGVGEGRIVGGQFGLRPGTTRSGTMLASGPQSFATHRATPVVDDMWVDIAFRITPAGKVADAKIVRSHGSTYWSQPLLGSLEGRRYTPGDPASPTSRRLERYTYTSGYERKTDTRSAARSPETRIEYLDLSDTGGLTETD
jgi:hypothetical protein